VREQYCIRTKRSFFPLRRALPPLVLLDTSIPVYNMRVQGSATKDPGTGLCRRLSRIWPAKGLKVDVNTTTGRLWLRGLHAHSISIY